MVTTPETGLTVTVHFFARYAELVGAETATLRLPGPASVSDVLKLVRRELPGAAGLPERPLCALNFSQVGLDAQVAQGDELALLPPVAGG